MDNNKPTEVLITAPRYGWCEFIRPDNTPVTVAGIAGDRGTARARKTLRALGYELDKARGVYVLKVTT